LRLSPSDWEVGGWQGLGGRRVRWRRWVFYKFVVAVVYEWGGGVDDGDDGGMRWRRNHQQ